MNPNPYEPPRINSEPAEQAAPGKIWVQIDRKWIARMQSPLFVVIASLTGVSVSFAPLALLMISSMKLPQTYHWTLAVVCLAVIFLVPGWYMRLAVEVLKDLRENRIGRST